jgi:hypothetical protein
MVSQRVEALRVDATEGHRPGKCRRWLVASAVIAAAAVAFILAVSLL